MLRPSNDDPRSFRPGNLNNVTATALLRNQSDTAMVPAVWHPFLNSRVDHDSNGLTRSIGNKQSPKRLFASVAGLSADKGPSLCPETLGTSQQPILRWRKLRARRFRIYVRDGFVVLKGVVNSRPRMELDSGSWLMFAILYA